MVLFYIVSYLKSEIKTKHAKITKYKSESKLHKKEKVNFLIVSQYGNGRCKLQMEIISNVKSKKKKKEEEKELAVTFLERYRNRLKLYPNIQSRNIVNPEREKENKSYTCSIKLMELLRLIEIYNCRI